MTTDRMLEEYGAGLGALAGIVGFLGAWGYCAAEYGFLWGFGFGWVPAIITGLVVAVLIRWLWIVAVVGIVGLGLLVLLSSLVGA